MCMLEIKMHGPYYSHHMIKTKGMDIPIWLFSIVVNVLPWVLLIIDTPNYGYHGYS